MITLKSGGAHFSLSRRLLGTTLRTLISATRAWRRGSYVGAALYAVLRAEMPMYVALGCFLHAFSLLDTLPPLDAYWPPLPLSLSVSLLLLLLSARRGGIAGSGIVVVLVVMVVELVVMVC